MVWGEAWARPRSCSTQLTRVMTQSAHAAHTQSQRLTATLAKSTVGATAFLFGLRAVWRPSGVRLALGADTTEYR